MSESSSNGSSSSSCASELSEDHFHAEPGDMIRDYELGEMLGHGSFGVIWSSGDSTAVKIGREEDGGDREIRMLRAMEPHDNVIRLHEHFLHEGRLVLVMERMQTDLFEFINEYNFDRMDAVKQIALGIQHISSAGVVHSDLKPENILVSLDENGENPVYKITDFGCAGMVGDRSCFYGKTVAYRSPEMCVGDKNAMAPPTDVWSYACIVFQIFTDNILFDPNESNKFSPQDSCESSIESNMEQLALMVELLGPFPRRFAAKHREYFNAKGQIRSAPRIKTIDMRAIMVHECGMELEDANVLYAYIMPCLKYTVRLRATIEDCIERLGDLESISWATVSEDSSSEGSLESDEGGEEDDEDDDGLGSDHPDDAGDEQEKEPDAQLDLPREV